MLTGIFSHHSTFDCLNGNQDDVDKTTNVMYPHISIFWELLVSSILGLVKTCAGCQKHHCGTV